MDLIFRDQSAAVVLKAQASGIRRTVGKPHCDDRENGHLGHRYLIGNLETQNKQPVVQHVFCIRPTLEERATCYFAMQYVVGIQAPAPGFANMEYMSILDESDQHLSAAFKAVSVASYAHHERSQDLRDASRSQYAKALRCTNEALRCPVESIKDSTLMAIMMLGMYEVMTGCNRSSVKAWTEHVRGSSMLLKLRGLEQMKTPVGRRLFVQASTLR